MTTRMTTTTSIGPRPLARARFTATLSNGGIATWTATVVRIENGIAFVRHPRRARTMPFSPVPAHALYKYAASKLVLVK